MENDDLEMFFVYRSLHSDDSWGAIVSWATINQLPNADFVIKVFANNEKEAIAKAHGLYDKIHHYDSDKDNIRRFACAALKSVIRSNHNPSPTMAAETSMAYAIAMNDIFTKHFSKTEAKNKEELSKYITDISA